MRVLKPGGRIFGYTQIAPFRPICKVCARPIDRYHDRRRCAEWWLKHIDESRPKEGKP